MNLVDFARSKLRPLFGRRSLENPNLPLNDPDAWEEAGLITRSDAGVVVNRKTALTLSTMFRGVSLVADYTAKTPLHVLRVTDTETLRDKSHHAYRLLRRKANSETLAYHFKQTLTAHSILQGGGFAYISRDANGRAIELWQLRPDRTVPVRENGELFFVTSIGGSFENANSELRKMLPENVLHIHGLGYDGLTGYSLVEFAGQTIGAALAKERYGARFFRNSANPSVVLKFPNKLSDAAFNRIKKSWTEMRTGIENAHKPAILEEGGDVEPFSVTARDAQMIEAIEMDVVMIANFIGLPPHKLGAKGYSSYNSLEQENQAMLDESLDPRFCQWEEECEDKLLLEREKDAESHQVRFHRQSLVRVDMPKRYAAYRTGLGGHPFLAPDEVRGWEDLSPVGLSDVPTPLNMQSKGSESDSNRSERVTLLRDTFGRANRRLAVAIRRQCRAGAISDDQVQSVEREHRDVVSEMIAPAVRVGAPGCDPADVVEQLFGQMWSHVRSAANAADAADVCAGLLPAVLAEQVA